jgi:hypothetical protein
VSYADAGSAVTIDLSVTTSQNTVGAGTDTITGIECLTGSAYNDTLTGDGNANTINPMSNESAYNGRAAAARGATAPTYTKQPTYQDRQATDAGFTAGRQPPPPPPADKRTK